MPLFPGVKEGRVAVDDVDVPYYDSGTIAHHAEPVLLVHGTAGNAATSFSTIFPLFAMQRRVVALDLQVPLGDGPVTVEGYARQVVAVASGLEGATGVHLVGHSLGAVVAAAAAAELGSRILTVTLVSGWMKTNRSQLLRNTAWDALARSGLPQIAEFTVFTGYSPGYLDSLPQADFDAWIERARGIWTDPALPRIMDLNRRVDITASVSRITAPSLVIACKQDVMVPPLHSKQLFGAIENARYSEIDGGHAIVQERPVELYFMIDEFINDVNATSAGEVLRAGETDILRAR
ncbi:alpha/beta fold hydrolase [Microbacterium sp. SYP-A9085]|uniref:alpha/beta fold hydrolase n=1 Tax=Microbacterium sp. SYP-A9085 TaxID=2664454 RepID=UPI00129A7A8F|nr:alpha/beta hydrolase [Microbacterium sp. SYP-A9085]MRH27772.1 alpha/beta fold hydrolase [Microbacterium sp. SYP-A9085]